MTVTMAKWTLEDYHQMVDAGLLEGRAVEFLHGEIVEMSPEGAPHAAASSDAGDYLSGLLGGRAQVRQAKPVTIPTLVSEPEPDLAIVRRLGRAYRHQHPKPEDVFWLVEYAQTSLSKDLDDKKRLYAEAGIAEYWVVNLRDGTLMVFRQPADGAYRFEQTLSQGELAPLAFPDLAVAVNMLL